MAVLKNTTVKKNMPTECKTVIRLKTNTVYALFNRLSNRLGTCMHFHATFQNCKFAVNRINLKTLHALPFASRNYEREKEWQRKWIDFSLFASGGHLSRFGGCQWTFALLVAQYVKDRSVWQKHTCKSLLLTSTRSTTACIPDICFNTNNLIPNKTCIGCECLNA